MSPGDSVPEMQHLMEAIGLRKEEMDKLQRQTAKAYATMSVEDINHAVEKAKRIKVRDSIAPEEAG